jgi:hypothetical protein
MKYLTEEKAQELFNQAGTDTFNWVMGFGTVAVLALIVAVVALVSS